jgi:peptidoglycan/xylan/chitin deacetylase (PgdA/CDA1 family)
MKKLLVALCTAVLSLCASAQGVPILEYHEIIADSANPTPSDTVVTVSAFNAQMKWLNANGYFTISATELATYMSTGQVRTVRNKRPIVLSFDDGWYNQQNALPGLRKYGFKGVFNIIGSLPGSNPSYMNWKAIKNIAADGHEIGSHTMTHPGQMAPQDVNYEVIQSKSVIESALRRQVHTIAWPNGFFSQNMIDVAKSIGYTSAQTIDENWCSYAGGSLEGTLSCQWLTGNNVAQDPFLLKRVFVDGRCTTAEFGTWVTQGHSSACAFATVTAAPAFARALSIPTAPVTQPNMADDSDAPRHERDRLDRSNDGDDHGHGDDRQHHRR